MVCSPTLSQKTFLCGWISPWDLMEYKEQRPIIKVFAEWWVWSRSVEGIRASCWMFQELSSRFYSNRCTHTLPSVSSYPTQHCKTHPSLIWGVFYRRGGTPELSVRATKKENKKKVWSGASIPRDLTYWCILCLVGSGLRVHFSLETSLISADRNMV